jgi:hypothetical protein
MNGQLYSRAFIFLSLRALRAISIVLHVIEKNKTKNQIRNENFDDGAHLIMRISIKKKKI